MTTLQEQVVGENCAQEITFRLSPNQLPRLEIEINGVKRYKTVALTQLLSLLDKSIVVEQLKKPARIITQIPELPQNTLFVDTIEEPQQFFVKLTGWIYGTECPFVYNEKVYVVKVPTMVYKVLWNKTNKRLSNLWLAVAKDYVVTGESQLYRWPFSNVFSSTNVCWSAKNLIECDLNQVVEQAVFAFIQTPNNRDLFGVGSSQNSNCRELGQFLETVKERGSVHDDWLIPLDKTVEEFHMEN